MPFSAADLDDLLAILTAAADAEILPRFQRLEDDDVGTKSGPMDLVTVADRAAEAAIAAAVAARFPTAAFVGEESVAEDPARLDLLGTADLAIVVDPIDGTFNFASGLPLFGVMAAVVAGGETIAGIILDPLTGSHMTAVKGEGARLGFRDGRPARPLRVAAAEPVGEMHGCVSWSYMPGSLRETVATRMARLAATYNYRCAAHEYRLAATGACHVLAYGKLMPWDHLAGCLIHTEAGGFSAKFDGSPYCPTDIGGGLLLAPDATSWRALREALIEG
ncbi:inositol monophosphatase family protein [Pinisolibacter sp.]|uniref:inositol monophosphatase family protein n=1 Tax=Pinisolibacter sp. TaxID=2172024 RepID=UPI003FA7BEAF